MSKFSINDMVMIKDSPDLLTTYRVKGLNNEGVYINVLGSSVYYLDTEVTYAGSSSFSSSIMCSTKKYISLNITIGDVDKDEYISSLDMDKVPIDVAKSMINQLLKEYE